MDADGAGDGSSDQPTGGNGALVKKNDAAAMVERGDTLGPSQLAATVVEGKWSIAATGAAAGLLISVAALFALFMAGTAASIGLVMLLTLIAGCCGTSLVMHGRLADIRRHLADAQTEVDRKAHENAVLLKRILEHPGSSDPARMKLAPVLEELRPKPAPKALPPSKKRKESKRK